MKDNKLSISSMMDDHSCVYYICLLIWFISSIAICVILNSLFISSIIITISYIKIIVMALTYISSILLITIITFPIHIRIVRVILTNKTIYKYSLLSTKLFKKLLSIYKKLL